MADQQYIWILLLLMPAIAFLYASVGHGGASSYIALLTLSGFAPPEIRQTALILNILVSGIAFYSFRKASLFPMNLFLPLILFSIPASFLGGSMHINTSTYKLMLGILLLFPVLRLFNLFPIHEKNCVDRRWWMAPLLGLSIGFVSGLIGIGGGIILSPVLLMLGWTTVKETSSVSALFIFLNSIAGLLGAGNFDFGILPELQLLLPLTIAGGMAGSYFGAFRFNIKSLKYLLGIVLLLAATKFIFA